MLSASGDFPIDKDNRSNIRNIQPQLHKEGPHLIYLLNSNEESRWKWMWTTSYNQFNEHYKNNNANPDK